MGDGISLRLEFSGGAELLVGKQKVHDVILPASSTVWTLKSLLPWVVETLLTTGKPELLVQDGGVRPGILVLVNEVDWELLGHLAYQLKSGDTVTFISTLHGG